MKYLTDYIQDATNNLFDEMGAFFAFSEKQFNEQKKEGIRYVSIFAGAVCPKDFAEILLDKYGKIVKNGIAQDIKENGKENIIKRELVNHEAYYTGDIESTVNALNSYSFTSNDIMAVYRTEQSNHRNE